MSNDIIFIGSSFDKKIVSYPCLNIIMTPVIVNKQTLIMHPKTAMGRVVSGFL